MDDNKTAPAPALDKTPTFASTGELTHHDLGCRCYPHVSEQDALDAIAAAALAEYRDGLSRAPAPAPALDGHYVVEWDERTRAIIATERIGPSEFGASSIIASNVDPMFGPDLANRAGLSAPAPALDWQRKYELGEEENVRLLREQARLMGRVEQLEAARDPAPAPALTCRECGASVEDVGWCPNGHPVIAAPAPAPALDAEAIHRMLAADGLLARCGVYWGEDPMAEPDDERRYWWMGTDGAGSVWAIEDEITIALIQQFTRVLANVAARMGIAAEQDAPSDPAPAPALDRERLADALHKAICGGGMHVDTPCAQGYADAIADAYEAEPVRILRETGPIAREDVEDHFGGVPPEGREVL